MRPVRLVMLLLLVVFAYRGRHTLFAWLLRLPRRDRRVRVERLTIPMADGVTLATDHYHPLPAGASDQNPTILIRTPYGRNAGTGLFGGLTAWCARCFAGQGYEVLVQDVRGRFDSGGEFEPFFHERDDARATLDWLAQQPWFDGQVGMWGSSYLGIVQWAIADHPAIKALVPGITTSDLNTIIFPDGALDLGLVLRWVSLLRIQQKRGNSPLQTGILLEVERDVRPAFQHLPVINADQGLRGGGVPYYQRLAGDALTAPDFAERLHCVDLQQVRAPVHLIGGWHDFFLRGLLADYAALRAAGQTPYLTIGPWTHFSRLFLMPTMIQPGVIWFDAQLKGQRQRLRSAPVRLYVMGANEWREYPDFPPPAGSRRFYPGGGQTLLPQPDDSSPDHYRYDPAHPTPIVGGTQFAVRAGAVRNHRLECRPDVLTYTTPPLDQPLEVIGSGEVILYVRSSAAWTDFYVRLCEVDSAGRSINICDGFLRIEPGVGELQPDGSLRLTIPLWATAIQIRAGHRIRLLIASSAHPRWGRHTNTASPLTDCATRPADQTIYHDLVHPSALVLPVVS